MSTWDVPCGIATYCANLVNALDKLGVRNDVLPLHPELWRDLTARDVTQFIEYAIHEGQNYDLIHIQHEHGLFGINSNGYLASSSVFGSILSAFRREHIPVVATFHTSPLFLEQDKTKQLQKGVKAFAKGLFYRQGWRFHVSGRFSHRPNAANAIVHSASTRKKLILNGMKASTIHPIPHGCFPQRDRSQPTVFAKRHLGYAPSVILLTMFGFLSPHKGHDVAIRALDRLPSNVHLAICGGTHPEGDDAYLSSLIKLIDSLHLWHRVRITGWLTPDQVDLYHDANDICLAPYLTNELSASGAITWALASGKPIIASKINHFKSICREQECMLLTQPSRVEELVWAVNKLVSDPDYASRLVAAASRYTSAHSWRTTSDLTQKLYEQMLSDKPFPSDALMSSSIVCRNNQR